MVKDEKKIFVGNKIDKRDNNKCDSKGGHVSNQTVFQFFIRQNQLLREWAINIMNAAP